MNLKVVNFYSTPEAQAWRLFSSSQLHCPFTENLKTVPNGGLWERHSPVKNPILLILQCECVCLCIWIQYPGRPKVSDPLEVEFQAGQLWAVNTGVRNWMKSGPFEKQFQSSTSETLLQSQNLFCCCCLFVLVFMRRRRYFSKVRNSHHLCPQTFDPESLEEDLQYHI